MASNLWACLKCGSYVKGAPAVILDVCSEHMCENTEDQGKNIEECIKILRKLHFPCIFDVNSHLSDLLCCLVSVKTSLANRIFDANIQIDRVASSLLVDIPAPPPPPNISVPILGQQVHHGKRFLSVRTNSTNLFISITFS